MISFGIKTYHKVCRVCGKEFIGLSHNACHCSEKCRHIDKRTRDKQFYEKHREQLLAYHREYRKNNRENISLQKHVHYRLNRERILARNKAWYLKNLEHRKEWARKYYEKNCELIKLNSSIRYYDKCWMRYYENFFKTKG